MKRHVLTIGVAGILVMLLLLKTICYTVQAGTSVARLRFQKIVGVETNPGLKFKLPAPIETKRVIDTRVRVYPLKAENLPTADQKTILVGLAVFWKIADVETYIQRFRSDVDAKRQLDGQARTIRGTVTQGTNLSDILSTDTAQRAQFAEFQRSLFTSLREEIEKSNYGVAITDVQVVRLALPEGATKIVFDRMIEERKVLSQKIINDGRREARDITTRANAEREIMISNAKGRARQIRGEGDAQAASHYNVFKQNPELHRFLRQLEATENVLREQSTVVLPAENPLEKYLVPLPEIEKNR